MATNNLKACKCEATPVVLRTNKRRWRVQCPCCQKFYTIDCDTREEAVSAWNNNIESVGKKAKKPGSKKPTAKK